MCVGVLMEGAEALGRHVHLIGIGGSGMSGAAMLLKGMGREVSGSDVQEFPGMGALVKAGVGVRIGHDAANLGREVNAVVYSAAIPEQNVELTAARARGLPTLKYAELIGRLMRERDGIAIAGTHGKSTTTALTAHILSSAGLDPGFIFGATSRQLGGGSRWGGGPAFVVEACEYDRSFLQFAPSFAAILNIESDHFDCYADLDALVAAFAAFAERVDPDGLIVCCGEDPWAVLATAKATARVETYGFTRDMDWQAIHVREAQGRMAFDVTYRGRFILSAHMHLCGRHNVLNALAAIALADAAGVSPVAIAEALSTFEGVSRRMSFCGSRRGITIFDDYAHHPTEIRATLTALRDRVAPKRTWVIFQPHQYNRTRHLINEFADSFRGADEVVVPDVYDARAKGPEDRLIGSKELAGRIRDRGVKAQYVPKLDEVPGKVLPLLREGDLVLTMGAGDVWKVADELVARIEQ